MLINHGVAGDPWTQGRVMSENPEIHPTAVVRASDFGRYTYLGPRSHVAQTILGDYGYAMGDNQIAHAVIGHVVVAENLDAALAASHAQESATRVAYDLHQMFGAMGMTLEHPLHLWTYRMKALLSELGGRGGQACAVAEECFG